MKAFACTPPDDLCPPRPSPPVYSEQEGRQPADGCCTKGIAPAEASVRPARGTPPRREGKSPRGHAASSAGRPGVPTASHPACRRAARGRCALRSAGGWTPMLPRAPRVCAGAVTRASARQRAPPVVPQTGSVSRFARGGQTTLAPWSPGRVVLSMECSCNKSVLLLTKTLPPGTEGPSTRGSSARSVPGARPPRTRKTGPGITGNSPSTATPAAARASRATRHTVSRLRSGRSAPAGWEHAGRGAAWVALWAAPSSGDEGCASQASRHGRRIAPAHRAPAHPPSGANAGRGQRRPWPALGRR